MALKKSELYSKLWQSCDELRGGMDASEYKNYILTLLFVKYISDKYAGDEDALVEIPEGSSFADMVKLKGQKDIGDQINKKILQPITEANDWQGVIDLVKLSDFNEEEKLGKGKEMEERLSNLVAIFEGLDFSKNRVAGDDLLGDAYEYLMRNFATQSGKSKGQYYTPAEVSRIIARVITIEEATSQSQSIYDPTCGSGSLLLKAADEAPKGITIYGQEKDGSTAMLSKMNMVLHGYESAVESIKKGNTLSTPLHLSKDEKSLKTFDYAVANPPFSLKAWKTGVQEPDDFDRFKMGLPPEKNGDFAFLLHIIKSLKADKGVGAIILPHGVLFRGNAEAVIRKKLIRQGLIKGIIGLPANLFYGTGIPACIIIVDKKTAKARRGIFMMDASKGFVKDGNKNRLREQDIQKIVDIFRAQQPVEKYARTISFEEIEKNEYNLNIPRYIDNQEAEDIHDLAAHLLGDIPVRDLDALKKYWTVYPNLRKALFAKSQREDYRQLKVKAADIKDTIFAHPEFTAFTEGVYADFAKWKNKYLPILKNIALDDSPKSLIQPMGKDLMATYADRKLIDKYDIYQYLMTYWLETMQDDVYAIAAEGWIAETRRIVVENKKGKEVDKGWECDLIPKPLIVAAYFAKEQAAIEKLEATKEEYTQQRQEMEEERSGEGDILETLKEDNKKIKITDVQDEIFQAERAAIAILFPKQDAELTRLRKAIWTAEEKLNTLIDEQTFLARLKNARGKVTKTVVQKRVETLKKSIAEGDSFTTAEKTQGETIQKDFAKVSDWKTGQDNPVFQELDSLHAYLTQDATIAQLKKERVPIRNAVYKELRELKETDTEDLTIRELLDLDKFLELLQQEKFYTDAIKAAVLDLDVKAYLQYPKLSTAEIKQLVVEDKWLPTLDRALQGEMDTISQQLTQRIKELAERYENTLPQLNDKVADLEDKVTIHLEKMGLVWN